MLAKLSVFVRAKAASSGYLHERESVDCSSLSNAGLIQRFKPQANTGTTDVEAPLKAQTYLHTHTHANTVIHSYTHTSIHPQITHTYVHM